MRSMVRVAIVVTLAAMMLCVGVGAAFGATNMNYYSNSVGYAHWANFMGSTSPIPGTQNFWWTNHPMWYWNFNLTDSSSIGAITVASTAYRLYPSTTPVPLGLPSAAHPATLSAEGFYTLVVTGTDTAAHSFTATTGVGLDFTRPTSWSDVAPVYDANATITLTATDTLSGAGAIIYSLDGATDCTFMTNKYVGFATTVNAGVGSHTLSWLALDCAGNLEMRHWVAFTVNPPGLVPQPSKVSVKVSKHSVTFSGTTTALTSAQTVTLEVQVKSGSKYKGSATYSAVVPKYGSSYKLTKTISKTGSYQVRAHELAGVSASWASFKIK